MGANSIFWSGLTESFWNTAISYSLADSSTLSTRSTYQAIKTGQKKKDSLIHRQRACKVEQDQRENVGR